MNAPIAEGHLKDQSSVNPAKEGTSLSSCPKPYQPGQGRITLGKTGLPDPGPLGAHGHGKSRGPINDFYGGY